jgi:hypothetical protein
MEKSAQLMQYFCSRCGILLKELRGSSQNLFASTIEEECPKCGSSLSKSMKRKWKFGSDQAQLQEQQQDTNVCIRTIIGSSCGKSLLQQLQLQRWVLYLDTIGGVLVCLHVPSCCWFLGQEANVVLVLLPLGAIEVVDESTTTTINIAGICFRRMTNLSIIRALIPSLMFLLFNISLTCL